MSISAFQKEKKEKSNDTQMQQQEDPVKHGP